MSPKSAQTSVPVLDTLAKRWSPRAFDEEHSLPENALRGVFEAARWAPSAGNTQPWRFILARRGSESFEKIREALTGFNQVWSARAAALVVNVAETADAEGKPFPWAEYDLGQAVAHLSVQAHSEGLFVHQMGGFDREQVRAGFGLEDRFMPISVTAIGELGDATVLPESQREREEAPRTRKALEEIVIVND